MSVRQISVFLENRAGQLAEISKILAEQGVDLRAISIAETADYGVLRLIADNVDKASSILKNNGYIFNTTPVLVIAVPDQPGGLVPVLEILATGEMDIEYMYSLFTRQIGKSYMVFRISDEQKFIDLLKQHNISPVSNEELNIQS